MATEASRGLFGYPLGVLGSIGRALAPRRRARASTAGTLGTQYAAVAHPPAVGARLDEAAGPALQAAPPYAEPPAQLPVTPSEPEHKEEDALKRIWSDPKGRWGWTANVQNGPVVSRFMVTVFVYFL